MKKLILIITTLALSSIASATDLPFKINRDSSGRLLNVVIDHKKKVFMSSDDFLQEFKNSIGHASKGISIDQIELEGFDKLTQEEQQAYVDALALLKQKTMMLALDDREVKNELDKVIELLTRDDFFKLLADPNNPKAFDDERLLVEAVEKAMDAAQLALGLTPLFSVLEFLVSEYFESLISQREFYQNALLVFINNSNTLSADEAALVKSSIFYSRLGLTKFNSRKDAIKNWVTFGLKAEAKANEKCKLTEQSVFHYCFKLEKDSILNMRDKNNSLSRKLSKAFDYSKPGYLGQSRWFILAAKLGLKLLPAPGIVKAPVRKWLESFYLKQRRTEGYLYSAAHMSRDLGLTQWILKNSANPLID